MQHPLLEIGDWKHISELGSGAFGVVMLWKNENTKEFVAIKKCKFQTASNVSPKQKERWHNEVAIMKSLNHANIINFKSLDRDFENALQKQNPTKLPLLSMEYCTKGNLRRFMLSEPIGLCGLPESEVKCVLKDVSSGLSYLHSKNITHRDIKPENVVLQHCDSRENRIIYKIIDLGYAKELQDTIKSLVGTVHYLAPEIFYTGKYDYTVDYWSLGLLVFEVICGVLPFAPELGAFERFQKIKQKGPNDICIYMQYSGSFANSSEIGKENFINSTLKQYIETWLKCVLQFNPSNRRLPRSLGVFEYLQYILDKQVINVFSVYKLEFYSYEINESTLLGTLKDWISRDIKVPKEDLIILSSNMNFCNNDKTLLTTFLTEDAIIFTFKKDYLLTEAIQFVFPKLLRELFLPHQFQVGFAKNLYRQALFFVYYHNKTINMLKQAYELYISYIDFLCNNIKKEQEMASEQLDTLCKEIEAHTQELKGKEATAEQSEVKECLVYFGRLLSSLERSLTKLSEFSTEVKRLTILQADLNDFKGHLRNILNGYDIGELYSQINNRNFFERKDGETNQSMLNRISSVVSDTIKLKSKCVKNAELKNCSKDFARILNLSLRLLSWIQIFVVYVKDLTNAFKQTRLKYQELLKEQISANVQFLRQNDQYAHLTDDDEEIRCKFEEYISKSIVTHNEYVEEFNKL